MSNDSRILVQIADGQDAAGIARKIEKLSGVVRATTADLGASIADVCAYCGGEPGEVEDCEQCRGRGEVTYIEVGLTQQIDEAHAGAYAAIIKASNAINEALETFGGE